jgi:succinate dehydrogenase / fumarate reductase iron-sulfur subunit
MASATGSSDKVIDSPEPGDPPLPPIPEGAVMVTLKIARHNPENPEQYADTGGWQSFRVPALPTDRVLNLLTYVKSYLDGSLTFRRSCAHGVCGSDAMQINGHNRLACKMLMRDLLPKKPGKPLTITIAPIRGLPVEKDLVVDMEPFFDAYRAIKPYLITSGNPPTRERIQSQEDRHRYDDTTKCILCAICTTSCPVYWSEGSYFGPASIVNAHRFIFDSRDEGAAERLDILNEVDGVWRCRTTFNCTEACPRGIEVTKAIQEVKRALMFAR